MSKKNDYNPQYIYTIYLKNLPEQYLMNDDGEILIFDDIFQIIAYTAENPNLCKLDICVDRINTDDFGSELAFVLPAMDSEDNDDE